MKTFCPMAKQLSSARSPLCFGFFRCHVDVLQSKFSRSTISFAEFSVSTKLYISLLIGSSIDPTFCGIFVCGPLQFKCQFCPIFLNNSSNAGRNSPGYLSKKVIIALKAHVFRVSNLMLTSDFRRVLSRCSQRH